ncbi:hypothetical protein TNCV_4828991 [Trichonephila clavipes]|nr:hypothetical protein TNCV_4828991 [Trichonephila clavipes]
MQIAHARPRTAIFFCHRDTELNGKKHKRRNGSAEMARASIVPRILLRTRGHETTPLRMKEDIEDVSSEMDSGV